MATLSSLEPPAPPHILTSPCIKRTHPKSSTSQVGHIDIHFICIKQRFERHQLLQLRHFLCEICSKTFMISHYKIRLWSPMRIRFIRYLEAATSFIVSVYLITPFPSIKNPAPLVPPDDEPNLGCLANLQH